MSNIKIVGLDKLKRDFLKQNWRGSKIKNKMRQAMKKGGKGIRNEAKNVVKSSPRIKSSALNKAAKAYGWKNYQVGNQFGLKLTPRWKNAPILTEGYYTNTYTPTPQRMDIRKIINFWGKQVNLSNRVNAERGAKDMLESQADFIAHLWSKGQLT